MKIILAPQNGYKIHLRSRFGSVPSSVLIVRCFPDGWVNQATGQSWYWFPYSSTSHSVWSISARRGCGHIDLTATGAETLSFSHRLDRSELWKHRDGKGKVQKWNNTQSKDECICAFLCVIREDSDYSISLFKGTGRCCWILHFVFKLKLPPVIKRNLDADYLSSFILPRQSGFSLRCLR